MGQHPTGDIIIIIIMYHYAYGAGLAMKRQLTYMI